MPTNDKIIGATVWSEPDEVKAKAKKWAEETEYTVWLDRNPIIKNLLFKIGEGNKQIPIIEASVPFISEKDDFEAIIQLVKNYSKASEKNDMHGTNLIIKELSDELNRVRENSERYGN